MVFLDARQASQGGGRRVDRDRNADAVAAARARHRARGAGPDRRRSPRSRTAATASRPISTRCATAARSRACRSTRRRDDGAIKLLQDIKTRWDRAEVNAGRVIDNQQSLTSLAKGLENINQGNNAILELVAAGGAADRPGRRQLREIEYANQLAVLSQRIAKNANALASSDEIDPEVAFLLGKDAGTFRDILNGLLKGSDALRLTGVRNEEARAHADRAAEALRRLRNGRRRHPAEHEPAGRGQAGGARHQQRVRGAARRYHGARRRRSTSGASASRCALWAAIAFVVLALAPGAARQGVARRRPRPRVRKRTARTSATRRRFSGC